METVAIVGVGLIGASFGLALRQAGFAGDLVGVSSPKAVAAGLKAGAISRAASLEEAVPAADLVYLAQPVDRILSTLKRLRPLLRPAALVTDAGSTKQSIVARAVETLPLDQFLGGHPMSGKEQRGAAAADASLFRGRPYVVTPVAAETPAIRDFLEWLDRIGANLVVMSAVEHDATVALTSHLPQVISTALALTLARRQDPRLSKVFGQGLLDMTRLALSPPELWLPIISTNRTSLLASLNAFAASLRDVQNAIETADLADLFRTGARLAEEIRTVDSPTSGKFN